MPPPTMAKLTTTAIGARVKYNLYRILSALVLVIDWKQWWDQLLVLEEQ